MDEERGKHKSFTDIFSGESPARHGELTSDDIVEQGRGATLCEAMAEELSDPRNDLDNDGIPDSIGTV